MHNILEVFAGPVWRVPLQTAVFYFTHACPARQDEDEDVTDTRKPLVSKNGAASIVPREVNPSHQSLSSILYNCHFCACLTTQ